MIQTKLFFRAITLLILSLFLLPLSGYGYIDLGSGSYIIQLILAAFVGISFSLKIYWKKIKARFSKKAKADKTLDVQ